MPACWSWNWPGWDGLAWAGPEPDQGQERIVLNILDHIMVTSVRRASSTTPILSMVAGYLLLVRLHLFLWIRCPTPRLPDVYVCVWARVYPGECKCVCMYAYVCVYICVSPGSPVEQEPVTELSERLYTCTYVFAPAAVTSLTTLGRHSSSPIEAGARGRGRMASVDWPGLGHRLGGGGGG